MVRASPLAIARPPPPLPAPPILLRCSTATTAAAERIKSEGAAVARYRVYAVRVLLNLVYVVKHPNSHTVGYDASTTGRGTGRLSPPCRPAAVTAAADSAQRTIRSLAPSPSQACRSHWYAALSLRLVDRTQQHRSFCCSGRAEPAVVTVHGHGQACR